MRLVQIHNDNRIKTPAVDLKKNVRQVSLPYELYSKSTHISVDLMSAYVVRTRPDTIWNSCETPVAQGSRQAGYEYTPSSRNFGISN